MRILIVNKFYYPRGGDCVASLNLEKLLKEKGHEVAFFSMQYPENVHSEFEKYFAAGVNFSGGFSSKIAATKRIFGWGNIKKSFTRLLDDFHPDVVHLQNVHSYISPIVAELAKKRGCRVVWTLHDYKLLCPSYSCLRNGKPCELCYADKSFVLKHKCMKGSLAASVLAYFEALKWNRKTLEKYTDVFVCPSHFMKGKMLQGGFSEQKLVTLCNFVKSDLLEPLNNVCENYYCYVGRLSEEKGVFSLLEVASKLPYILKVAGDGPLYEELKEKYASCPQIQFLGKLKSDEVKQLLSKAKFSVMPSECYDNNPLGVIESLCEGTPVLGADIGGIPELIDDSCGMIFESGNQRDLNQKIELMFQQQFDVDSISQKSSIRFSSDRYYAQLMKIYENRS